jgi:hypothetical protein
LIGASISFAVFLAQVLITSCILTQKTQPFTTDNDSSQLEKFKLPCLSVVGLRNRIRHHGHGGGCHGRELPQEGAGWKNRTRHHSHRKGLPQERDGWKYRDGWRNQVCTTMEATPAVCEV